jgi:3-hydroxy-9,10-secoandrosta-1,3,5(10)-triene-9,17-dione monooxygenase
MTATVARPTEAELLERASDWVPTLIERSASTEELRRIPDETRAEFIANQFHLVAQPTRFGGIDLGIGTAAELAMEVGRGCGSTAWMTGQWPGHQFMVGTFPLEAQQEYWGPSPDTLSSTASAAVKLNVTPERGGVRVTDTLVKFSSGVDHAEWIILMSPAGVCLVPRKDFTVVDDWDVMGLRGTGSKSLVIGDAWVPPHRIVPLMDFILGTSGAVELYPDTPLYRVPANLTLNLVILAPAVGIARGLVDIFDERARTRIDGHTGQRAAERPGTQMRFAESTYEIDVATKMVRDLLAELSELGRVGTPLTLEQRTRLRRDITQTARLAVGAAERLLTAGDASGMYSSNRWQRWGRDIKMAGLQTVLTQDEPALTYSQVRWGMEPTSRHT